MAIDYTARTAPGKPCLESLFLFATAIFVLSASKNVAGQPAAHKVDAATLCAGQTDCGSCIGVTGAKCYYCYKDGAVGCRAYPFDTVVPPSDQCPLTDARWVTCSVNLYALIIGISISGMLLLIILAFTICYCWRRKSPKSALAAAKVDAKWDNEAAERHQRFEERKAVRDVQIGAIRQKYGLGPATTSNIDVKSGVHVPLSGVNVLTQSHPPK